MPEVQDHGSVSSIILSKVNYVWALDGEHVLVLMDGPARHRSCHTHNSYDIRILFTYLLTEIRDKDAEFALPQEPSSILMS